MPHSRLLAREAQHPQPLHPRERPAWSASRKSIAISTGTVALATALTLVGAPAAEALGLI